MGEKIHMELKFLRLEFHHFISLLLPCVYSCSVFFFVASVLLCHSTQRSSLAKSPSVAGVLPHRSTQCSSPTRSPTQCLFVLSSDLLWVLFFFSNLRFFFFFGSFFFFFSGFFLSSSSFFFFWVCTFFVLYLKSSVKNSRSMWHNHVQFSKLGKWEASLRGSRLNRTRVSKTRDASLQFSFRPVLTYHILSLHNISMQISSVFTHQRMVKCNVFFKQMTL